MVLIFQASLVLARGVAHLSGEPRCLSLGQKTPGHCTTIHTQTFADGERPLQHSSVPEVLTFFCFNHFLSPCSVGLYSTHSSLFIRPFHRSSGTLATFSSPTRLSFPFLSLSSPFNPPFPVHLSFASSQIFIEALLTYWGESYNGNRIIILLWFQSEGEDRLKINCPHNCLNIPLIVLLIRHPFLWNSLGIFCIWLTVE